MTNAIEIKNTMKNTFKIDWGKGKISLIVNTYFAKATLQDIKKIFKTAQQYCTNGQKEQLINDLETAKKYWEVKFEEIKKQSTVYIEWAAWKNFYPTTQKKYEKLMTKFDKVIAIVQDQNWNKIEEADLNDYAVTVEAQETAIEAEIEAAQKANIIENTKFAKEIENMKKVWLIKDRKGAYHMEKIENFIENGHKLAKASGNIYFTYTMFAISYQINTGRSYTDWEKALLKANPAKLLAFVGENSGTYSEAVIKITDYLKRYCRLGKEEEVNYTNTNDTSRLPDIPNYPACIAMNENTENEFKTSDKTQKVTTEDEIEQVKKANTIENTNNEIKKFEVGKTYETCSICDSDCIFSFKIIKRTAKTVTIEDKHGEKSLRRISIMDNNEIILPHGNYSMAPILRASDIAEKETEIEQTKKANNIEGRIKRTPREQELLNQIATGHFEKGVFANGTKEQKAAEAKIENAQKELQKIKNPLIKKLLNFGINDNSIEKQNIQAHLNLIDCNVIERYAEVGDHDAKNIIEDTKSERYLKIYRKKYREGEEYYLPHFQVLLADFHAFDSELKYCLTCNNKDFIRIENCIKKIDDLILEALDDDLVLTVKFIIEQSLPVIHNYNAAEQEIVINSLNPPAQECKNFKNPLPAQIFKNIDYQKMVT